MSITRPVYSCLILVVWALAACGDLGDAAYLPQPSPAPTLARLATVTAAPPTRTPAATATPAAAPTLLPTATPEPIFGVVLVGANVRAGPGTEFDAIAIVNQGEEVRLRSLLGEWYEVELAGGQVGWMLGQLLLVDEARAALVPTATPAQ
jgi:SH3-like domain-containing protein